MLDARELATTGGQFDVVTAVEVLEHAIDPLATLRQIRDLLRPGGLLFLTTGNLERNRKRFASWPYVMPELHLGYFAPQTLARALTRVGLRPIWPGYRAGTTDIIRFTALTFLGIDRRGPVESLLPWSLLGRALAWYHGGYLQPAAIRADSGESPNPGVPA